MRAGLEQDDIWVMVEDEFLSTAHLYTSHLHKAEYLRLKKLARSQNASTIESIARPVDDRTEQSGESKKKIVGARQRAMGTKAMQNLEGDRRGLGRDEDENEDDDPWMRDPRLAGLMTQRENSTQLSRIAGAKSKTRASAGYAQASQSQGVTREIQENMDSQEVPPRRTLPKPQSRPAAKIVEEEWDEDEEEDSDDVGGPSQSYSKDSQPHPPPKPIRKAETPRAPSRTNYTSTTSTTSKSSSSSEKRIDSFHSLKSKSSTEEIRPKPSGLPNTTIRNTSSDLSMDLDDFDGFPKRQALSSRAIGRFGKKKEDPKEAERKKRSEEVPTFLF